ncbi:MAG: hypothetical protein ABI867_10910 [Kofleriaceae bacterium]
MTSKFVVLVGLVLCGCGDDGGEPPPGGDEVTVEIHRSFPFVDGDTVDEAQFVAVQDGDGAFIEVLENTNGIYKAHIDSQKFGVAVGCVDELGAFVDIEIVQQTVADGLTYQTICKSRPAEATLDVAVTNLQPGQRLRLRSSFNVQFASADGTATLSVPPGKTELFGTLTDANRNVVRLFRLSVDVTTTATVALDMISDGAPPDIGTFAVTPDDNDVFVTTSIVRPYGTIGLTGLTNPVGTSRSYIKLPASLGQPDDLHRITLAGATGTASQVAKSPGALAFELPEQFSAPAPVLAEVPYLHPIWTFDPTATKLPDQSYFLDIDNFSNLDATIFRTWFVRLSASWIGDAATVRYEFPDFSGMTGFAEVSIIADERLDTTIQRIETTAGGNVDGARSTSSSSLGVLGRFCGDGTVISPEACDPGDAGETETCDDDCTAVSCGDGVVNFTAGEDCDPPDDKTCSATCTAL